jgi:hypothetical protein
MLELGVANPEMRTTSALARVILPDALRGQMATVSLIPLPPSDRTTPPHTFVIPIPLAGQPFSTLELPTTSRALRGQALDALGSAKVQYTARAFRNGVLVSTTARTESTATNPAGNFVIIIPSGTSDGITLELAPDPGSSDPWVTYGGLSLMQPTTDLGAIMLPAVLKATPFQVTIHGGDGGRDAGVGRHGACVRDARGRRRPGVGQVHPGRCLGRRRHGQPVADAGRHGQSASVHAQRRPSRGLDVGRPSVSTTSPPSGPGRRRSRCCAL